MAVTGLRFSSGPAVPPLSLTELKAHLRVDITDDDTLITAQAAAAVEYIQQRTRRQLVAATVVETLPAFPTANTGTVIKLQRSPALAVSSISYLDSAGAATTWTSTNYQLWNTSDPSLIYLAYNSSWPSARVIANALTLTYKAGYIAQFTAVVDDTLTWVCRTPVTGEVVRLSNTGGTLPAGLSADIDYYVIGASGQTCKLSLTLAGTAVDVTDTGTGTHFIGELPAPIKNAIKLLVGDLYEHREGKQDVKLEANDSVEWLLGPYLLPEFY